MAVNAPNMSLNYVQRGLSTEDNMAVDAGKYQRSTAGIVLQVVVGLLTAGIGALGIELYHASNRTKKVQEFTEVGGALLKGMQEMSPADNGFSVPYKNSTIELAQEGSDIKISFGGETTIIRDKTLLEVRENLKRDILANMDAYGPETVKIALRDETANQRTLAIQYLQSRLHVHKFDHLSTATLVRASTDLVDQNRTAAEVEEEFSPSGDAIRKVVDAECLELINAWTKMPPQGKDKVHYAQPIAELAEVGDRPMQSESERKVRKLTAEIFFPEKSWEADTQQAGERLKGALLANSALLAEIYSKPDMVDDAGLPDELNRVLRQTLVDLKEELGIFSDLVDEHVVADALRVLPGHAYTERAESIDEQLTEFEFRQLGGVEMLGTLAGMGEGNFQEFLKQIFENYFDNQSVIDKRAMLASYLTNSGAKDSDERKLVALLKAGGPYMQKLLQLFGDRAEGELKAALDELKTGLSPINEDIIKAVLAGIVDKSAGKITKIDVGRSLGAASVGQAMMAKIHWRGKEEPQEVVVKILRPGIRLRADRELEFFERVADGIPGMGKTFKGISEQIQVEMDLKREAENVRLAQVYNLGAQNVQAMKLADGIAPSQGYMVLEKAPGSTMKAAFDDLNKQVTSQMSAQNPAPEVGAKLASGIKELTKKWVGEALFGSGFYHGDLHAGNIMFSRDAKKTGVTTVIDMGNAAVLSVAQRSAVFKMVLTAGLRNPDVFVKNFEQVLSDDGKKLIKDKRADFLARTREIMAQDITPGEVIVGVLNAANELGLEIPATVSNFSRSQMMLQNAIDNINNANATTLAALKMQIDGFGGVFNYDSMNLKDARAQLVKQRDDQIDKQDEAMTEQLTLLIGYIDVYQSGALEPIDFGDIIMDVVKSNLTNSVWLATGDIFQMVSAKVFA
ncbi:MAG: AarF/UbiB family protein [Candidimonas sp.]